MADNKQVKLILTAEDNISSVIKKVADHLQNNSGLAQAITATSTSFIALKEAADVVMGALGKVWDQVEQGIDDAANAENVNKRLAMSMAVVGQYSEESFLQIQHWASGLEEATGISDEAFRSLVALGLQYGLSTEQSMMAADAARNLAAATGQDMDTAFRQMSATLSGSAGRLEKMIPEIRNLTKEELENGMAIEIIAKKYQGFADNAANSFTGATARMDAQIGNVKEAFGRMIAQNPAVISAIDGVAKVIGQAATSMDEFSTWVINNSDDIKTFSVALGIASTAVFLYANRTALAMAATIAWNTITGQARAAQTALGVQTASTSALITAQATVEKASAAIKALFNAETMKQVVQEKLLQAQFVAGLVVMKSKQAIEAALATVKGLMTAATLRNTAAEAASNAQMAISSAAQKAYAAVTGILTAVKSALTLENLKNTASMVASTAVTVAKTVATYALAAGIGVVTVAQNLFNVALTANPIGLAIVAVAGLTAGIYYLYKNLDMVTGAIKVGLGYALQGVSMYLSVFLTGIGKVVAFFNEDWGKAIENAADGIAKMGEELKASGRAQMAAADAAKKSANDQTTSAMQVQRATEGITNKIKETEQELVRLNNEFSKAMEKAETAFKNVKDLMPRMRLEEFQKDSATWVKTITDLKTQAEALKVKLSVGVDNSETQEQLKNVERQIRYAEEGLKAIKIKNEIETREAVIKEEEIKLQQIKARTISTEAEIGMMRIDQAKSTRETLIQIETQRLLAQRGLASQDAQAGITARQAAELAAREVEMNAFRAGLEAKNQLSLDMTQQKLIAEREVEIAAFTEKLEREKTLAVDMELQKQIALAELKANAMSSNTAGGAGAQDQVEILQAQAKMNELQRLREADMLSEQMYQQELTALKIQEIQARTETEMMLNQQKQELLGTSPEALAMALENEKIKNETELLMLQEKLNAQMITEAEFTLMKEEAMQASAERQTQIKEQMLQREVEQNTRLKNHWQATLAQIRLEQEKHGQLMGTIKGIQQSREYGAMQQGLSDLASLRSSSDRKAFEAGKAAAIAQTTINTFMSATAAYSSLAGIPIVGPALGIAAAAAAIMAGMNNIAQIKSQKFQGGAHGGIDEVPKSMNNSTFVLKAGERVVQPDQNKELGQAIDKINEGQTGGGHSISIVIQGNASEDTVAKMKDALIDVLRESSERGTPIIHEKGIVRG